ncbi:putative bis (5'-nucleosyl) tetraphosphatase [Encephalitozoon intestinalis ATCC 50506]|uniref:Bis (5'-nucleosyl) tetraphosphatase n=1 Tax=Encephalitozoon intestinalis (strain ATCC 50506) TaxID=876142 RepID=E0S686_ENCIT|nr:putative bis (5'-nucleosyl) tetraphosphatase [Encephalitozoon intestinalis ATCC 50506]ADM11221.1 putative bis (5'-nucleosyl) tetraphosphatase [Encephalitozoon intestinalis ATCC 50506]UTX44889.1 hypothetical protein GPK93_03g04160 [Encephalitozoon intestinalis]
MKESEVIGKIEGVFGIEDPAILPERVKSVIKEILEGGVFPVEHPFYVDFINLSFDVLYPGAQEPSELLRRSGFTQDQLEKTGLKRLFSVACAESLKDDKNQSELGEDLKPKRRKKVSWGANLVQIKEIEKTVMETDGSYPTSSSRNGGSGLERNTFKWIIPEKLDHGYSEIKSPGRLEQERREANSIRMSNTEEHRRFSPTQCTDVGEDNETITVPVINFAKNKMPNFDFRKIVEDRFSNMARIHEILEDPSVVDILLGKEE